MRVVSIDPAIRNTGFAVIDGDFRAPRALEYGTLSPSLAMSKDASALLIAIGTGNRAIIGSVDLTKF